MDNKLKSLRDYLAKLKSVAVAFSGGVDSSFLLKVAYDVLGENAVGIHILSPLNSGDEKNRASEFCGKYSIPLLNIEFDALSVDKIRENPKDRCYFCKKEIFSQILNCAKERGFLCVADGSNVDDESDFRPGMKALEELNIVSPLRECGLTKADVRTLSREIGLETWDMPSAACLASRIAYGETITLDKLAQVDKSERFLRGLGFEQCRVRVHGNLARVEVEPSQIESAVSRRGDISAKLKDFGFDFVALDLQGYKMGSLNVMNV